MDSATNNKAFTSTPDAESASNSVDVGSAVHAGEERAKKEEEEESKAQLARLEYEIQTLRNVLIAKMNEAGELKRKLGITPMVELKQDLKTGIQTIKESETVKKTNAALKSFGDFASRKMVDLRNSDTFKSVEERFGGAYANVKKRVSVSASSENLDGTSSPLQPMSPTQPPQQASAGGEELNEMLPESKKTDAQ